MWLTEREYDKWVKESEKGRGDCTCRVRYFIVNNGTNYAHFESEVEWDELCPLHGVEEK